MPEKILGLDLGTNSIGWALLEGEERAEPNTLVGIGVRVFTEAVDPKSKVPKNAKRRAMRGARKNCIRRKQRRRALESELLKAGLLPTNPTERAKLFFDHSINPYALRAKGLTEKLSLHEFGRAIYHLNQRRGYKSNRRATRLDQVDDSEVIALLEQEEREAQERALEKQRKREEKGQKTDTSQDEESVVLAGIATLKAKLSESNKPLGAYFASLLSEGERVRAKHTERNMYEAEFEQLWEAQKKFHPTVLTDGLRATLHNIIFHQRPLKVQRFLVENCRFEPSRKRAMKAHSISQSFRIWQEVNNLQVTNIETKETRFLTQDERVALAEKLQSQLSVSWSAIRTLLTLPKTIQFNFEDSGRDDLKGNSMTYKMSSVLGETWGKLDEREQEELEFDLLNIPRKDALVRRLRNRWQLTAEQAYKLATWEPPAGTANLSVKAMRKLLPHLKAGLNYRAACEAVGYLHPDQIENETFDLLPAPPDFRNPVVNKAANQVRRVINAIIRKHGKPTVIRIEMARDMKLNKKEKEAVQKQQKINKKANEEAARELAQIGISAPSRLDLVKYRLWKECGGICPYTGHGITLEMLRTGEVDIEHIVPYSRSLDDSFNNLTLCFGEENRHVKKNKTPFEAYGGDRQRWDEMLARISEFKRRKRILFSRETSPEELTEKFAARKLSDTRYICRAVKEYVSKICPAVTVTAGETTALLRSSWGLNSILGDGETKSRDDHRHHSVDALVVALTSVSLFQKLSKLSGQLGGSLLDKGIDVPAPFANFWQTVKSQVDKIIVSHAPGRGITGGLHEETAYGRGLDATGRDVLIFRKPLAGGLTDGEIKRIRDPWIQRLVLERIAEAGDSKKAFADEKKPLVLKNKRGEIVYDKFGRPRVIKSVRLIGDPFNPNTVHGIANERGEIYKWFLYGNNHHVEILECLADGAVADGKKWKEGQRRGVFVTAMEAANRARRLRVPVVQRDHGPDWKFVMSLCINDIVLVHNDDRKFFRVQKFAATNNSIWLRPLTAATIDDDAQRLIKSVSTLSCTKLAVGPLGDLHPCRD